MNEFLFFFHVLVVVAASFAALRLGSFALVALVGLQAVMANVFVLKQMSFFGLTVTCSDVYAIGSVLALNLLQEFYGRDVAKKAIFISFFSMVFFVLMSQIHLAYVPSPLDATQSSFASIFSVSPRIFFASIGVYWIVQRLDISLFSWLKTRLDGKRFPLRLGISLFLTQCIDTVLFSFLGLYGIAASLFDIILVSLVIKWLAIGCSALLSPIAKRFARVS